ncbi:hypothetical protein FDUTEX481_05920 [Tolypothrix sp. PCC 7601]|nr:hypothetical protein FDUTEX481_05920 [Tolypothrix sp. PCC 7601]
MSRSSFSSLLCGWLYSCNDCHILLPYMEMKANIFLLRQP